MQYAIINLSGKQYKVKPGDTIETERLNLKPGDKVSFEDVLLVKVDSNVILGTPKVEGVCIKATILDHTKGEKVRIAKFKAKSRYRRVTGNRQSLTTIKIGEIVMKEKPTVKAKKTSSKALAK